MTEIVPVILCGGGGTRLWPRSRLSKPKPFIPLIGDSTLFEAAIARCHDFAPPIVVTGAAHVGHVEEQLGSASQARIIVEPAAKNTAAAIALAAARLPDDAVMLVCPSDHYIADAAAFADAARAAASLSAEGWLVSFGIEAKSPDTGFGYLKQGETIDSRGFKVAQFIEKPPLERAQAFLAEGGYAWNGGIFAFRVSDFMAELDTHRHDIAEAVRQAVSSGREDGRCFHPDAAIFGAIDGDSVDYVVMERTARAAMVPVDMGWSDIGNWQALHAARAHDDDGNSLVGQHDLVDCRNVLVDSDGPRVSVIGLEGVIVVVDGNDILITTADGAQKVGKLPGALDQ